MRSEVEGVMVGQLVIGKEMEEERYLKGKIVSWKITFLLMNTLLVLISRTL